MALIITPRQLTHRAQFYYQLGQLSAAGIGLITGLEMVSKNPPAGSFRKPLEQILLQVHGGSTFGDAVQSAGTWTPSFDLALLRAGEHSGRLDSVFKLLGDYYTDRAQLLKQMISDLMYPAFLLHFAVFILPFAEFFSSGNATVYLLKTMGALIPIYILAFGIVYTAQSRRGLAWRTNLEKMLRPVPVLGAARHYLALARLSAALEALIRSGVNIIEAWDMAAAASGSPAMHNVVQAWRPRVVAGQTPAEAVRIATSQFPELFANLYHTGEISGQLDDSLRSLYKYYSEEAKGRLRLLAQWIPKFIYLGIAVMVAFRIISFYQGYMKQIQDAGGF
jgi:type II secretory pathway component PulF